MKKLAILALASLLFLLTSCEKNPLWVGKSEFITVEYTNAGNGPGVSSPIDHSDFVEWGAIYTEEIGGGTIDVVIEDVRVQSKSHNFEIDQITVYERDGKKFEKQAEFLDASTSNKTNIAAVLVLDMSTSVQGLSDKLKDYAIQFVDIVTGSTPTSRVAVVFFSGKDNISTTAFYTADNADDLRDQINAFNDFQPRTALFEAAQTGISMLDALNFEGAKSLIVFTDGGDNDTDFPDQVLSGIQASDHAKFSIGLEGADFDRKDLEAIAGDGANTHIVKEQEDLQKTFEQVARQVVSVYRVVYSRSDQLLNEPVEVKFEFEVEKL